jgi:hypothetical protein
VFNLLENSGGILGIIISVIILILLLIGLRISRKYSFKAGVYFFVLLIIHKIYTFAATPLIGNYVDGVISGNIELSLDMTIAQLTAWISVIPKIIELAAFIFLIIGLFQLKIPLSSSK